MKDDKSPGIDELNYDIVKQKPNSLLVPLKCIFDLSLKSGTFQEKMKITGFYIRRHLINDKLPTHICTSILFKNTWKINVQ